MASAMSTDALTDLLVELFADFDGTAVLVDPSVPLLSALGQLEADSLPATLNVFAREDVLKTTRDDFLAASALADHITADRVELRLLTGGRETTVLTSEDTLSALIDTEQLRPVAIPADDDAIIADAYTKYQEQFDEAERFSLRTPSRIQAMEQLGADVGEDVRDDLEAALATLDEVSDDTIDAVSLSLLIAARNKVQLYNISKWGEDTGVASKATFSRTKTNLEDLELITTQKVPIDVGRPRLRLLLADDELASADITDFAAVAQQKL